jgi:hypothetical protein
MAEPEKPLLENPDFGCYNGNIPQEMRRAPGAKRGRRSPAWAGWRLRMRVTSTVVVMSSLLVAAAAVAAPNDKPTDKKKPASGAATGSAAPAPAASPVGGIPDVAPTTPEPPVDLAAVKPEDMPTAVRMRRLEQKTQALKERAWQLKARVQMLKEQMIGGGAGAQAVIDHANEMGASFRLTKLIYALDGTQVFVRTDDSAESLYKTKSFDVFAGPISPGNHQLIAEATYRGHGYGVFEYLSKYTFTARGNQAFLAGEGKISKVDCRGFEKGGPTTPLEKRAAIECAVTELQPEHPAGDQGAPAASPTSSAPASPTPGPTSGAAPSGTMPKPGTSTMSAPAPTGAPPPSSSAPSPVKPGK